MSIRIIALPDEAAAAVSVLRRVLPVIAVRGPYPCRSGDRRVRLYLEIQP